MAECFICMETENQLYKVCRCDTVVHALCLAHLVNNTPSHSTNCPVCRQAYDISITEVRRWLPIASNSNYVCSAVIIFTAIFGSSIGMIIILDPYKAEFITSGNILLFNTIMGISSGLAAAAVLCVGMVMLTHIRTTGHVCCYALTNVIINREINLSNSRPIQIQPIYTCEPEA